MKKTNGITLIALVITIIVLLILAGISISMLSGDNSILSRATEAKEKTENSRIAEEKTLATVAAATNIQETTYKGITIPEGFAPTNINGESTVDEGLVITDSRGNEYVWIEVPNDGSGPDYTGVEVNNIIDTSKIYTALDNYSKNDLNGNTLYNWESYVKDVWYDSNGKNAKNSSNLNDDSICGLTSTQYLDLYNKMLISIYKNGGFWIGRYEAGFTSPRDNSTASIDGITPMSKQNLYPINYISCKQAQTLASSVLTNEKYSSSVMFGIQWNLVMKFLSNKGVETSIIKEDSRTIGNYGNTTFIVNRGEYYRVSIGSFRSYKIASGDNAITVINNVSKKNGDDENYYGVLCTTGASDEHKVKNIYDLAGNIAEFTLSMKNEQTKTLVGYRGGHAFSGQTDMPLSEPWCHDYDQLIEKIFGFRVSIY